jgi:hypothetical protein
MTLQNSRATMHGKTPGMGNLCGKSFEQNGNPFFPLYGLCGSSYYHCTDEADGGESTSVRSAIVSSI